MVFNFKLRKTFTSSWAMNYAKYYVYIFYIYIYIYILYFTCFLKTDRYILILLDNWFLAPSQQRRSHVRLRWC